MRLRRAYILVLILSLLVVDESSPFLLRPASANILFSIPLWLRIFRTLRTVNFSKISKVWDQLRSFLRGHGGRLRTGDVVDGISRLQDYFQLFGYLNSTLNSNFTDEFSAELESAIKYFQKTFHLNATGQPDNATASLITLPRCGFPDVINGSITVTENSTTPFTKWWQEGKIEFTYAFSPENETMTTSLKVVFSDAFSRWSVVTRLNFTETTSFNESDIRIMFLSLDGQLGLVGGGWLDKTTMSWGIVLDVDEKWVLPSQNSTESDELDLETVVMHQIGHVLGLSHSAIEEAVMYPFNLASKKRKVDFAKDELERIQQFYGAKSDSSELSPAQSPSPETGVVGGAGPRWGRDTTLWLGIMLLFWF
ncbi:metalloendoproteinase 2-MMP-like [Prosopis cineraria]|uniref:metalloendoproteinase 2-MMP-like n=1 Tax=Prosopis cineraria TaxID=364024 RepID=UPI00240EFB7A|nr:metalloendoproteinase 2-MMP-like [Prosopis cineraria]